MQIERYSNTQYAGIHDREISFQAGINVILGDNESGKSTMLSGILQTLLMPSKLDKRKHKEFIERSFPTNRANFIDGEVHLVLNGQRISVKKEWDKNDPKESRTMLRYIDENKRVTGAAAEEELKALLQYGDAVYEKLIFGRQDNEDDILDWFFSFLTEENADGVMEARKRISGAISAAGGISEELFLQKLDEKLKKLGGHWDFERDRPENDRGLSRPWQKEVGKILEAYYQWQEKILACDEGAKVIQESAGLGETIAEKRKARQAMESMQKDLQSQRATIENAELLRRHEKSLHDKLLELDAVLEQWPGLLDEIEKLETLMRESTEKANRERKSTLEETLSTVRTCQEEIDKCHDAMTGMETIEADARICQELLLAVERDKAKLSAVKLNAVVTLEQGHSASVETADGVVTSGIQHFDNAVNGYVKIAIPGVGEVSVTPQDVGVDALKQAMDEEQTQIDLILRKYDAGTYEALTERKADYLKAVSAYKDWENKLELTLNGRTAEEILGELNQIQCDPEIQIRDDLEAQIQSMLAGSAQSSLESRKAVVMAQLAECTEKFSDLDAVKRERNSVSSDWEDTKNNLAQLGEVSMTQAEYEFESEGLTKQIETLSSELEENILSWATLSWKADEIDLGTLQEERAILEQQFLLYKKRYGQYIRIKDDFLRLKNEQENQYQEFYGLFNSYLQMAAGEELQVLPQDGIVSKGSALPGKEYLSQGTKKLILLAFRLALLKYYFHDESGVIVLDDILLDMDPDRREGAAKILAEFAKENQVIFTTCDPAIAELLGGNRIVI